jgi:hypothetical protein
MMIATGDEDNDDDDDGDGATGDEGDDDGNSAQKGRWRNGIQRQRR